MRELKFRSCGSNVIRYASIDDLANIQDLVQVYRNGDIQQYTGVKDKNKIEIYEGDVIKYTYMKGFSGILKTKIAKVEFVKGCFGFYEYKNEQEEYFNSEDLGSSEVIGNIFENSELLNV